MVTTVGRFGLLALWAAGLNQATSSHLCDNVEMGYQCQADISHYWGMYSPYFKVATDIPDEVPAECGVKFVQLLQRHGARGPTASKGAKYEAMIQQALSNVKEELTGPYAFLNNFTYTMRADDLSPLGAQQSANSGVKFYNRYKHLADKLTPFVRSSAEQRVVDSATNWTAGFHSAKSASCSSCVDLYPYNVVEILEGNASNNTLDSKSCTQYEDGYESTIGDSAQAIFASTFTPPIMKRLNADMPNANLTQMQTIYFMDMCPFETVSSDTGTISDFCKLFTKGEWRSYNYYQTLGKFYSDGWGNPLGATRGVGFVNELIARLTATAVQGRTSTNSTLDSSNITFPITGGPQLFADFSHDDPMMSIFSAFGFYNQTGMLSNTTIQTAAQAHGYSSAWLVPFSGRAYIEKQECTIRHRCGATTTAELVRVIINDRVIPLQNCGADHLGRCTVDNFVKSLAFARDGGNWDQCFL